VASLLDGIRRIFRVRRHGRFSVTGKAMVIVAPGEENERRIQILNISKGGLAFVYDGSPEELTESGILQLLANNVVFVEKVNYDTASDLSLQAGEGQYRRRGVKFKWLGVFDEGKLDDFIKEVGSFQV